MRSEGVVVKFVVTAMALQQLWYRRVLLTTAKFTTYLSPVRCHTLWSVVRETCSLLYLHFQMIEARRSPDLFSWPARPVS